jgi:hypothetical protein
MLDCALLMRNVPVMWNPLPPMSIGVDRDSVRVSTDSAPLALESTTPVRMRPDA